MDTNARLESLIGKKGILKIANHGEAAFTYLAFKSPAEFPPETDLMGFNDVVSDCNFLVRFDNIEVDGRNTAEVSGYYISRLEA